MAFLIASAGAALDRRPMSEVLTHRHLHDLGKLLLAFVMVWAYFSFSQFLIIWAGNLPEEIPWYLQPAARAAGRYIGAGSGIRAFRAALRAAALARSEDAISSCCARIAVLMICHAVRGSVIGMVAPEFFPETSSRQLDGFHRAHRFGGNLAGVVPVPI